MSEAELVMEFGASTALMWSNLQWWVSFSFAVMVAAYVGAQRLTKRLIAIIFGMYFIAWLAVLGSMIAQTDLNVALRQEMGILRDAGELSLVGISRLESTGMTVGLSAPLLFISSIVFTYGFVMFCYTRIKKDRLGRAADT